MSFKKVFSADLLVLLAIRILLVRTEDQGGMPSNLPILEELKGNCLCGGFSSLSPPPEGSPVLCQAPGLEVSCNDEGVSVCSSLCSALAAATKAKGPEMLCEKLSNVSELKLSAYAKVCERPWVYVGITSEDAICCEDGAVKKCPSANITNYASQVVLQLDEVI